MFHQNTELMRRNGCRIDIEKIGVALSVMELNETDLAENQTVQMDETYLIGLSPLSPRRRLKEKNAKCSNDSFDFYRMISI